MTNIFQGIRIWIMYFGRQINAYQYNGDYEIYKALCKMEW